MFLSKVGKSLQRVGTMGRFSEVVSECQHRFCSTSEPSSGAAAAQSTPNTQRVEKTINQITLLGRVGADPQKRGNQEHPVVVFSLATHANYQYNTGDMLQKTDWHRICIFKPYLRDTVYRYLTKGQRVLVQGRVTYGDVKDENGISHTTTSIIADDVTFFLGQSNKIPSEASLEDVSSG